MEERQGEGDLALRERPVSKSRPFEECMEAFLALAAKVGIS